MKLIKIPSKITSLFLVLREKINKILYPDKSVLDASVLVNIRRIYYLALIAIPLRIVNIILISLSSSYDTPVLKTWSQGIIASHFILFIFMICFFLLTYKLKNKPTPNTTMFVLQYIVVFVIMASTIVIVTLDQLITTNITPFLLICVLVGTVFLFKPLTSFIIYCTSYVAYYHFIALTMTNQQVLLSNRVNGITAIGIGFLLSVIMWNYHYINTVQKQRIKIQQKQLEQMAYYDPLTNLPNRRYFYQLIEDEVFAIKHEGHESVIIILDIDNFKNINDTYGHLVGDNILRQLAILLESNIRESDTVSRFGGEEFVILMPSTSLAGGYAFAERLRQLIMEKNFIVGSTTLHITASFGISLLNDIQDLDDYYSHADKALYMAKQSGKNRVEIVAADPCVCLNTHKS